VDGASQFKEGTSVAEQQQYTVLVQICVRWCCLSL
jgi:hypothetical protein